MVIFQNRVQLMIMSKALTIDIGDFRNYVRILARPDTYTNYG